MLTQFVDRVERGLIRQRQTEKRVEEERERIADAKVPAKAFDIPLEEIRGFGSCLCRDQRGRLPDGRRSGVADAP